MTGPSTGTAKLTAAGSAATTVATGGVSTVTSSLGLVSSGGCASDGGGCSSGGGVNITGTISVTGVSCFVISSGDFNPMRPITRKRKQIELAHPYWRFGSLAADGRQNLAKSE